MERAFQTQCRYICRRRKGRKEDWVGRVLDCNSKEESSRLMESPQTRVDHWRSPMSHPNVTVIGWEQPAGMGGMNAVKIQTYSSWGHYPLYSLPQEI